MELAVFLHLARLPDPYRPEGIGRLPTGVPAPTTGGLEEMESDLRAKAVV